jgi:uncharacterized protein (DUF1501 family)
MKRRTFLKAGLGVVGAQTLLQLPVFSSTFAATSNLISGEKFPFLVQIHLPGGADATLGLDPLRMPKGLDQNDIFIEYQDSEILSASKLKLGPAAKSLAPFANSICIVNGINMQRDAGHLSGAQYIQSGSGDGKQASLSLEQAFQTRAGDLGVLNTSGSAQTRGSRNIREIGLGSLNRSYELGADFYPIKSSATYSEVVSGLERSTENFKIFKQLVEKFGPRTEPLKATTPTVPTTTMPTQIRATGFELASLMSAGLVAQIFIELDGKGFLDTHTNHPKVHLGVQTNIWEQVARLFSDFKKIPYKNGTSMFDVTTFVITTEFSRTPALNGSDGKDHNPFTNSLLVCGPGIQGNQVIGQSHVIGRKNRPDNMPLHIGSPFDFKSSQSVTSAADIKNISNQLKAGTLKSVPLIFPEDVINTIGKALGWTKPTLVTIHNHRIITAMLKK